MGNKIIELRIKRSSNTKYSCFHINKLIKMSSKCQEIIQQSPQKTPPCTIIVYLLILRIGGNCSINESRQFLCIVHNLPQNSPTNGPLLKLGTVQLNRSTYLSLLELNSIKLDDRFVQLLTLSTN